MAVAARPIRLGRERLRLAKKIKKLLLNAQARDNRLGILGPDYQPLLVVPGDDALAAALQLVMNQLNTVIDLG